MKLRGQKTKIRIMQYTKQGEKCQKMFTINAVYSHTAHKRAQNESIN